MDGIQCLSRKLLSIYFSWCFFSSMLLPPARLALEWMFVPHTPPLAPSCPGTCTHCDALCPPLTVAGADASGVMDVTSQTELHTPPPFRCKCLLASWKEGLAQVVSSCCLHTPVPVSPRAGVWLSLIVCFLKPPVSAAFECLHCARHATRNPSLFSGPGTVSLGIQVIT